MSRTSPLIEQYLYFKKQSAEALLLFRVGSFYELLFEDAKTAANVLDITLTSYGRYENESVPSCGFPVSSMHIYVEKLLRANYRVIVCEQLKKDNNCSYSVVSGSNTIDNTDAKDSVLPRYVSQTITPGTFISEVLINRNQSNYLLYLEICGAETYLTWLDCSIGMPFVSKIFTKLLNENLSCINPREILVCKGADDLVRCIDSEFLVKVVKVPDMSDKHSAEMIGHLREICIKEHLKQILDLNSQFQRGILQIMAYFHSLHGEFLPQIFWSPDCLIQQRLNLSNRALSMLGICHDSDDKSKSQHCLFSDINRTVTAGGYRLLRHFFTNPTSNYDLLQSRFRVIENLTHKPQLLSAAIKALQDLPDVERGINLMLSGKISLQYLFFVHKLLLVVSRLNDMPDLPYDFSNYSAVNRLIWTKLRQMFDFENCSFEDQDWKDFNSLIVPGQSVLWDKIQQDIQDVKKDMHDLQDKYSKLSGMDKLQISLDAQRRMSIAVSSAKTGALDKQGWIYQNSSRGKSFFTTAELMILENRFNALYLRSQDVARQILMDMQNTLKEHFTILWEQVRLISSLDVAICLSRLVIEDNYVIPEIKRKNIWRVKGGWHPQLKRSSAFLSTGVGYNNQNHNERTVVRNDCTLTQGELWLITGPNMSGKSIFLKQNAIIAILAHMGCPVPAENAEIGVLSGVFMRLGFNDDLLHGHSTFLCEMIDCARLLTESDERSLVIIDELGRGTRHHEGVAIAQAIIEHIHDHIKCMGLISTHYDELLQNTEGLSRIGKYHMQIRIEETGLKFLYFLQQGSSRQAYGIFAAKHAGLPSFVCQRAQDLLRNRQE